MKKSLALSALVALSAIACAPQKADTNAKGSANTVSREHCMTQNNNASCFLEIESEGSSKFYAPERDIKALQTNPVLADMNIPMKEVKTADYAEMVNKYGPTTLVYDSKSGSSVEAFANTSLSDSPKGAAINGWWGDFFRGFGAGFKGSVNGAIDGAKKGAELGSVIPVLGTTAGAIGGAIIGAIQGTLDTVNSLNGKVQVNYHFGNQTVSQEAKVK